MAIIIDATNPTKIAPKNSINIAKPPKEILIAEIEKNSTKDMSIFRI